ncbi:HNH endonuclease [candidate division WOR-3 bacterium]|nr:HNH endonuclease [candidate division WOR-3 bacterium]
MPRRCNTNANGRSFSYELVDAVWEKGHKVRGKNPNMYRRDECGNLIYKPSYGNETPMGWEIDHRKPVAKGGTDHMNNLRPLQSEANAVKGDKYPWN